MVTTLENKRVGYIDKSEAAQLAIEMDNENKELAVKGFKLTPLARIVECLDIHKLRVKVVVMNNVRCHNEQLALLWWHFHLLIVTSIALYGWCS